MKDHRAFAAGLGFAFVAAWIAFSFGEAILCLLGAAVFWVGAAVLSGNLDLGELQGRLRRADDSPSRPAPSAARRPKFRSRVQ